MTEKYIISKILNEFIFGRKNNYSFCQCGNWPKATIHVLKKYNNMLEVSPPIILFVKMLKVSNLFIYLFIILKEFFFLWREIQSLLEYSIFDIEFPILVIFGQTFVKIVLALW